MVTCAGDVARQPDQASGSQIQALPQHTSLPLVESDTRKSGGNVRRKSSSSRKAVGRLWPAFRILPGWEGGGGEFIYRQKGSASSRRRKMNDINFSHSYLWDWA